MVLRPRWWRRGCWLVLLAAVSAQAQVTIVTDIENFSTEQSLTAGPGVTTSTVSSLGSIGGYRTLQITRDPNASGGSSFGGTGLYFYDLPPTDPQQMLWSSGTARHNFQAIWGGADGTSGLGGFQFGNGQPLNLALSFLRFGLVTLDLPAGSNLRWEFQDTQNRLATYETRLPQYSPDLTLPPSLYEVPLNLFQGSGELDWNAVNFVKLAGGDSGLDLILTGPFQLSANVPEPASASLLIAGTIGLLALSRRRNSKIKI